MEDSKFPLDEMSAGEKLWLLAGELLRDAGVNDVNAHHVAKVLGQALACVTVYGTRNPLDPVTHMKVMNCAEDAALEAHEQFLHQARKAGIQQNDNYRKL
jgi:hypothetical protein